MTLTLASINLLLAGNSADGRPFEHVADRNGTHSMRLHFDSVSIEELSRFGAVLVFWWGAMEVARISIGEEQRALLGALAVVMP